MNPLLAKARAAILAKVDPRLKPVVLKLVNAGHQVMFSEKTRHLMTAQLQGGNASNPEVIGAGIAKLLGILYGESKKTAPIPALVPAGMVLLCDALDFLEEAGQVKVTPDFLAQCTQAAGSAVLQLLGVKPEQVQQALSQAHATQGGAPQPGAPAGPAGMAAPAGMPPAPPPRGVIGAAMGGA